MPTANAMPEKENARAPRAPLDQQIPTYFTAEERAFFEEVAHREMRSLSGAIRLLALRGRNQYKTETLIAD